MAVETAPPLLEREAELERFESAIEAARLGRGRLLVLEGAAGIGKTRLLEEARRLAADSGMLVLSARGSEVTRDFPFALVRQLFEQQLASADADTRGELLKAAAAPAGPVVGIGSAPDEAGGGRDRSFAILNALYWLTSNLAEAGPIVQAVDDAHWSDAPSLRFFRFLAARLDDLPVLLIVAARAGEPGVDSEQLDPLVADSRTDVIRPRELSDAAVRRLVREALDPAAEDVFCSACHRVSGGNPFLVRELITGLAVDGVRGGPGETERVKNAAPATIRRAALLRLGRLPGPATSLARAVAVLGDDVSLRDAADLAGLDPSTANGAADALALAGILEPTHPLCFIHPLTRTAVYADLIGGGRAAAHGRAAEMLAERGAEPERIAVHLLATDPGGDAGTAAILHAAARRALDRGAPETAAACLERALAEPPPADSRLEVMQLLLRAYSRAGDQHGFEKLLESGAFDDLVGDQDILLESAEEFAQVLSRWGRRDQVKRLLERAIGIAAQAGDGELIARFQAELAFRSGATPADGLDVLERFGRDVPPDSPTARLFTALRAFWALCAGAGREAAADLAEQAVADGRIWAENLDNPIPDLALYVLRHTDRLDSADRALAQQLEVVASRRAWAASTQGFDRGELALLRGDAARAEAELRIPVELERQVGSSFFFPPFLLGLLVETLVERDDLAGAEGELAKSELERAMPDHWWYLPLLNARARLRLAQGSPGLAVDDVQQMARIGAEAGMRAGFHSAASYLALALHGVGDREAARGLMEPEVAAAREWGLSRRIGIALRTRGQVEGGELGLGLIRESIGVLEASPYRLDHARSLTEYGAALRRANRRAEAREPLRTALAWARTAGALAVARQAHEELEATGERLRPLLAEGAEALTPSERRVADLAAEGHTNREIAQALFLSVKTIETHLSHVYRKLDIESRRDLGRALDR